MENTSQNVSWLYIDSLENISDVLTFNQFVMFEGILSTARAVISLFGILGNTINIMTFISMGIKDGFSLSMTLLAGIELFHVIVIFMRSVAYELFITEYLTQFVTWFPFEPFGLYVLFGYIARPLYSTSVLMTSFLSFARCMCVSRPLHFKNMFTVLKSVTAMFLMILASLGFFIPLLNTISIVLQNDPQVNHTRFFIWITPSTEQVRISIWRFTNVALILSSLGATVYCVFLTSKSLTQSVIFRLGSQPFGHVMKPLRYPEANSFKREMNVSKLASGGTNNKLLTGKERRAIKQMLVMSLVVIMSEVPEILISLTSYCEPTFGFLKPLSNIYMSVLGINHTFQAVKTSVSIVIYWKYSSRFRQNCCLGRHYLLNT